MASIYKCLVYVDEGPIERSSRWSLYDIQFSRLFTWAAWKETNKNGNEMTSVGFSQANLRRRIANYGEEQNKLLR